MPLSNSRPWIIGHRGVPGEAPENTLGSFELAISQGADLIEIDMTRLIAQAMGRAGLVTCPSTSCAQWHKSAPKSATYVGKTVTERE